MRYVIILLLGLIVGAGAAVFFLGTPRARSMPGTEVHAPDAGGAQAGTVIVTITEGFSERLLATIFQDLGAPSFQLARMESEPNSVDTERIVFQQGCTNTITLAPEGSNTKTEVQFANGKISAPLAFSGSYNLLGNCMQFKGWAQTSIQLRFDQASQTVYGQVNVEGINLEGVNPMANNFVTVFVRDAIDQRVNPLELIRAPQLQLLIPVKASNGEVKAQVKDVRAEILDGSLKMHISYEFSGTRGQQPQS
ncbi:MAG TPA: hypothetical protein VES69_01965 [Pyrinomonadaceae bacterium]|nr:hypothetical protein [Pyrinomonadaceae bacterium]